MAEEIAVENGRICNYEGLVTLTLDQVILHTVGRHSWTSTYMPNFNEIEETICGRTEVRTYVLTYLRTHGHLRPALLSLLWKSRPKMEIRHPVEGSFGSEFLAISNQCIIMAA